MKQVFRYTKQEARDWANGKVPPIELSIGTTTLIMEVEGSSRNGVVRTEDAGASFPTDPLMKKKPKAHANGHSTKFKTRALKYAALHSVSKAATRYKVSDVTIRKWQKADA